MNKDGKYKYLPLGSGGRPVFVVGAKPHLMLKLKRHIPAGRQDAGTGNLFFSATRELARDFDAFLYRHPLDPLDADSAAHLARLVAEHRGGEEQLVQILEGEIVDFGSRQPELKPREYQLLPRMMVRARGYLLLGDGTGLGKTLESALLFSDADALRGLVVCPTHLVPQWLGQLRRFYPWIRTHKLRQGTPYTANQKRLLADLNAADVVVSNYHKLAGWGDYLRGKITSVIFDEAQELRTGSGTGKYIAAAMIARDATFRMACTATPVYNRRHELHNVVAILDPDVLGTMDEFLKEFPDSRALGSYLRESGILLRRSRKDVGRELPPVTPVFQPVETDHRQLEQLLADGIVAMAAKVLDDATSSDEKFLLSGQFDRRLRQATGVAKAPFVAAFVEMLLESGIGKVTLAAHHHDCYEIYRDHLRGYGVVEFTGRQSDRQKEESLRQFIDGDARVLLMAVRSGSGTDGLQTACSTLVFGEPDWSPAVHTQLIDRFNRDGQPDPVMVFYMVSDAGSDPPMFEVLEGKRRIAEPIVDPDAEIVQPSADDAIRRVQLLARAVLRQHGVNPTPTKMPEPVPGSGELFPRDQVGAARPAPALTAASPAAAIAAAAERAQTTRILEDRPDGTDGAGRHSREDLRARLTGAQR